jgi:hypothetical protein
MQISTIKNPNFEKPFRNPSNRTQVNILKTKIFGYLSKKIWFRVCSVTAKMFELQNSGENQRKRSEFFFENLPRECKDLILVKKKFKIISCLGSRWVFGMASTFITCKCTKQASSPLTSSRPGQVTNQGHWSSPLPLCSVLWQLVHTNLPSP